MKNPIHLTGEKGEIIQTAPDWFEAKVKGDPFIHGFPIQHLSRWVEKLQIDSTQNGAIRLSDWWD